MSQETQTPPERRIVYSPIVEDIIRNNWFEGKEFHEGLEDDVTAIHQWAIKNPPAAINASVSPSSSQEEFTVEALDPGVYIYDDEGLNGRFLKVHVLSDDRTIDITYFRNLELGSDALEVELEVATNVTGGEIGDWVVFPRCESFKLPSDVLRVISHYNRRVIDTFINHSSRTLI